MDRKNRAIKKLQFAGAAIGLINVALRIARPGGDLFGLELAVHALAVILATFLYPLLARFRRFVGWACLVGGGVSLLVACLGAHHLFISALAIGPGLLLLFDRDIQDFDWTAYWKRGAAAERFEGESLRSTQRHPSSSP